MKKNLKTSTIPFAIVFTLCQCAPAFAQNLQYSRDQEHPFAPPSNVQQGQSQLAPVGHGTDYNTQFAPYASFMQSPYGVMPVYQRPNMQSPYPANAQGPSDDPLMASEMSPYSKYSPYIEVIGEGSDYKLGIDDVVTIIVRNQPDFSGRFVIDPEGNVQYNFVGDIPAAGKTKEELKTEIAERLKKFVRYPEAAVMISEYRSKAVYVFGYVNAPGKYAMKGDKITVKDAVVAAGLPREDAALKRVYVIRPDDLTESGEAEKRDVDLKKLLKKGETAENFVLLPGDTIVVEQKYFDKFVNAFSRLVGPLFQAAAVYELGWGQSSGFLRGDN